MCKNENQFPLGIELSDEQLNNVVGGVSVGDQVKIDPHMIVYCPKCSRLINGTGQVIAHLGRLSSGQNIYRVRLGCCDYETSAAEYTLSPV